VGTKGPVKTVEHTVQNNDPGSKGYVFEHVFWQTENSPTGRYTLPGSLVRYQSGVVANRNSEYGFDRRHWV